MTQRVNQQGQPVDEYGRIMSFTPYAGGSSLTLNNDPSLIPSIDNNFKGNTLDFMGQQGINPSEGMGFNLDTLNIAGNVMGGVGDLAKGWAALKGIGVAKDQLSENQRQYDQNYAAQRTTVNNEIRDRQALLSSAFYNSPERAKALQVVQ